MLRGTTLSPVFLSFCFRSSILTSCSLTVYCSWPSRSRNSSTCRSNSCTVWCWIPLQNIKQPITSQQFLKVLYSKFIVSNVLLVFYGRQCICNILTNLTWKIWPFSNFSQQYPTCRNTSQRGGQTHATCRTKQCCDMLRWNVAIVWPGLKVCLVKIF